MQHFLDQRQLDRPLPSCTVVIATRNRAALLDRCLEAVMKMDYPRFEVLVVDNAPLDETTREVAARWEVRYIVEPVLGVNRARNRGAAACESDVIAYIDDDAVPERMCLSKLVEGFSDPLVMAVTGRILPLKITTEAERLFASGGGFDAGPKQRTIDGETPDWFEIANFGGIGSEANMAFRRSAFSLWPGFAKRFGYGTPLAGGTGPYAFFALIELGYRVVYTPEAIVHHPCPETMEALRARHLRTLQVSAAYMLLLFFEHGRYRNIIMKYAYEWIRGVPRQRRGQIEGSRPRLVSRWRELLACSWGPVLYARSLLRYERPNKRPRTLEKESDGIA